MIAGNAGSVARQFGAIAEIIDEILINRKDKTDDDQRQGIFNDFAVFRQECRAEDKRERKHKYPLIPAKSARQEADNIGIYQGKKRRSKGNQKADNQKILADKSQEDIPFFKNEKEKGQKRKNLEGNRPRAQK